MEQKGLQRKVRAALYRGGTSKALLLHEKDLPGEGERDSIILAAYGSPDPSKRQIDGIGGGTSLTSKLAIISPSNDDRADVNYLFGQVSLDKALVDYKGNCGNISSAVGPFAVDEGLVVPSEPFTTVRIFQVNTRKYIYAEVPVKDGLHDPIGDYTIDGVSGTGAKITLRFLNPAASLTDKLFPTGKYTDDLSLDGYTYRVTIIDAASPVVFVRAEDLGLRGEEINEIDENTKLKQILEGIRSTAAVMIGLAKTPADATEKMPSIPKIAIISPPKQYTSTKGTIVKDEDIDITARMMSMGTLHRAYAVTGAIPTAGAARVEGTIVNEMLWKDKPSEKIFRIGHPGGIFPVEPILTRKNKDYNYEEARVGRTARRLMDGHVYVPNVY